jgi:hypothetical protein
MLSLDLWTAARNTAVWWSPIIAGFIGAFGTHLLTQSHDREKWILDSKKQEYRELLDALSESYSTALSAHSSINKNLLYPYREDTNELLTLQGPTVRVFTDRIFIVKDIDLDSIKRRWGTAIRVYSKTGNSPYLTIEYDAIHGEIVTAANRAIPKTISQRLMFWKD